jgi:NAD-dependent dihydropyrimidine dehydrogenase PreA subunit
MNSGKPDRGILEVDLNECKGCGLCIDACPTHVISMSQHLNHYGYQTATYAGSGCTACGICFMVCPEPGALTVYRLDPVVLPNAQAQAAEGGMA